MYGNKQNNITHQILESSSEFKWSSSFSFEFSGVWFIKHTVVLFWPKKNTNTDEMVITISGTRPDHPEVHLTDSMSSGEPRCWEQLLRRRWFSSRLDRLNEGWKGFGNRKFQGNVPLLPAESIMTRESEKQVYDLHCWKYGCPNMGKASQAGKPLTTWLDVLVALLMFLSRGFFTH